MQQGNNNTSWKTQSMVQYKMQKYIQQQKQGIYKENKTD